MPNICNDLRLAILQSAFQGKLTKQLSEDDKAKDLLDRVKQAQKESGKKLKEVLPVGDDDQLFSIPDSWYWVRIGDIFDHNTGKTKNAAQNITGESRKYITTSNMYWNHFDFSKVGKMNFKEEELEKYTVKKGDILVCEGGDFGRTAIWNYDEEVCFQNHIHRLRFFYPMNTTFFYWLFFFYKNANLIKGKGIGIQGLSSSALHNIAFPLPPLAEQKRIVEKIDELMARVADLEQSADALASLKKAFPDDIKASLLQYAMQGKLTKQLPEDGNAGDLLEEIKAEKEKLIAEGKIKKQKPLTPITDDEIPFSIPENWKWVKLNDILDVRDGTHDSPKYVKADIGVPLVTSKNLRNGSIDYSDVKYISIADSEAINQRSKVDIGDILMAMIGTIGNPVKVVEKPHYSIKNMALLKHLPKNMPNMDYILHVLNWAVSDMKEKSSGGVQKFVSLSFIREYPIPLPPLAEQERIVERLGKLIQNINTVEELIASE